MQQYLTLVWACLTACVRVCVYSSIFLTQWFSIWFNFIKYFFSLYFIFSSYFLPSFTTPFDLIAFIQIGFSFQLVAHIHIRQQLNSRVVAQTDRMNDRRKKKQKHPKYCIHIYEIFGLCTFHSPNEKKNQRDYSHSSHINFMVMISG